MQLNCAYIRGGSALPVETFTVSSDTSLEQLGRVVRKTATSNLSIPEDTVLSLRLTKTPPSDVAPHSSSWLGRDMLPLINAPLVERGCFKLPDGATTTGEAVICSALFGHGFVFNENHIHIVAIIHDDGRDGAGPLRKRVCARPCAYTRPRSVLRMYCVPLDTIDAFQDLRVALTLRGPKPIVLLHGAPFSGKSTIAGGICDWIHASVGPGDECFLGRLQGVGLDEANMWTQLSRGIDLGHPCTDKASFLKALGELPCKWRLIVDQLDVLLTKPALATQFLVALREIQTLPNFGGFLGIGNSGDLQSLVRDDQDLFHESMVFETKPFSVQQMLDLFRHVRLEFGFFSASTGLELMAYSGGSPGVLGSLLEFMVSRKTSFPEGAAWKEWFEAHGYCEFVKVAGMDVASLKSAIDLLDGVESRCLAALVKRLSDYKVLDWLMDDTSDQSLGDGDSLWKRLVYLGVFDSSTTPTRFTSPIMARIVRDLLEKKFVVENRDPVKWLCLALQGVNAEAIGHRETANVSGPSESVFHFELYAALRLLPEGCTLLPEAKNPPEQKRTDLLLFDDGDESSIVFELKVHLKAGKKIKNAARQAAEYKKQHKSKQAFVVNFARYTPGECETYRVNSVNGVEIVHVLYTAAFNEYYVRHKSSTTGQLQTILVVASNATRRED